jgi:cyclopropane fatty-acyl-phospholipid synthase-like methyltransferase
MNHENYLKEYFTNSNDPSKEGYWRPKFFDPEKYPSAVVEYDAIVADINDDEKVLDVGCGYHPFKGRIKNLIGIDKYNTAADVVVDMLDYEAEKESFDVVIALGATNLHSFEVIESQIAKLDYWCRPGGRIYMRVNPVLEEITPPKFAIYKWTMADIAYFTRKHNFEIIKPVRLTDGLRYVFTWQKQK